MPPGRPLDRPSVPPGQARRPHPEDWRWYETAHRVPMASTIQVIEPPKERQQRREGPRQAFGFARELEQESSWDGQCQGTTKRGERCRVQLRWPCTHCSRHAFQGLP
jgi:hypothetical protein